MRHELGANQISLANFFIFNPDFGQKEGKEAEKIFYYYPADEKIEKQIRIAGFCAGIIKFTQTFKSSKPCEYVHTEKIRMVINQLDDNFWMVIGLNVPLSLDKIYENDLLSDQIYMSVLKKTYNYYRLFNGKIGDSLKIVGQEKLKEKMKIFFDDYIETKLNVFESNIMNTFNGLQFMSLDRNMYLKIQSLLNLLEEKLPLVQRVVVMHNDQVIWSGLEQDDISAIYQYLKELISKNTANAPQSQLASKFLVDESLKNILTNQTNPSTSNSSENSTEKFDQDYFEFKKVFLDKPNPEQFYLIPYNLSKITFFVFIPTSQNFKLSLLKEIDEILANSLIQFVKEISEQQLKRSNIFTEEKEIKYIYFNRLNLAQKSTLNKTKDIPKHLMALISELSKDLESCVPNGEIFVKSGKDYWIACKKSDLREVYVVVCQKNANLTMIDDLKIRLKVKINPKKIVLIRKFYQSPNENVLLINICIKKSIYSTMINFRNSKEPFIFMIINDFDIRASDYKYAQSIDIQRLVRWDHLKDANVQIPKLDYVLQMRGKDEINNLSLLVQNLSPPVDDDLTIEIVQEKCFEKNKNPADLNEAFANDTFFVSKSASSSTQTIEPSFVENNCEPKSSSQIENLQSHLNISAIPFTTSSITISKIQELTDDESYNISKTYQFSPKLCDTHTHCIKETQNETKKRRMLLDSKFACEFNENSDTSLISDESDKTPGTRITRTNSSSSTASTSSSSLSLSISHTPKSLAFRPKANFLSEPRYYGQKMKSKDSHLVFSPIKIRTERKQKLREIKKKYLSNPQFRQMNSPAKANSDLVDKILNMKNVMSSDEDECDIGKLSFGRRRLLFDKKNQLKEIEKAFDSVDKSIPSGQNQCLDQTNSLGKNFDLIQNSLMNYRFVSDRTDDKLQEYLVHLAEMTKSTD